MLCVACCVVCVCVCACVFVSVPVMYQIGRGFNQLTTSFNPIIIVNCVCRVGRTRSQQTPLLSWLHLSQDCCNDIMHTTMLFTVHLPSLKVWTQLFCIIIETILMSP